MLILRQPRKGSTLQKSSCDHNSETDRLTFLKHNNIYAKTRCNISGLYLNSKEVSLFNENFVGLLNTLDSEN